MGGGFHPPLSVILSWPKPNYKNPVTRGDELLVGSVILVAVALMVVVARIYARFVLLRQGGLDDYLIILSMLLSIALLVFVSLATAKYGWDRHIWDVNPKHSVKSHLNNWIAQFLFLLCQGSTKVSILLFYRRMVSGSYSITFKWTTIASIFVVVGYTVSFCACLIFYCWPTEAYWLQYDVLHPYQRDYHCGPDQGVPSFVSSVISTATDFLATLLPLMFFSRLQMPRRQKISLGIIFGLGFLVCGAGIVRTIYCYQVFFKTYDITWVGYKLWAWTFVEANVAIICASAPALKPFFNRFFAATTSYFSGGSGSGRRRHGYSDKLDDCNDSSRRISSRGLQSRDKNYGFHAPPSRGMSRGGMSRTPTVRTARTATMKTMNSTFTHVERDEYDLELHKLHGTAGKCETRVLSRQECDHTRGREAADWDCASTESKGSETKLKPSATEMQILGKDRNGRRGAGVVKNTTIEVSYDMV